MLSHSHSLLIYKTQENTRHNQEHKHGGTYTEGEKKDKGN